MLKTIHRVQCYRALGACPQLMQRFALWLCDLHVVGIDITHANAQAQMPSRIEADWLWWILNRTVDRETLQQRAQAVADLHRL